MKTYWSAAFTPLQRLEGVRLKVAGNAIGVAQSGTLLYRHNCPVI